MMIMDDMIDDLIDSMNSIMNLDADQLLMINISNIMIGITDAIERARLIMTDDDIVDLIIRPFARAYASRINALIPPMREFAIDELIIDHLGELFND